MLVVFLAVVVYWRSAHHGLVFVYAPLRVVSGVLTISALLYNDRM